MKQLLFLLLFPCFAMAQYQGNGNQKITLGEQTTADGLVWRGVENDTALITPRSDTSAYIILDTINNKFYNYNRSTNVWSLAGGGGGGGVTSFSAGTTGLTPSTATTGAVTLGGTLAVANGGTNTSTAFTAGSVVFAGASGTYTQNNSNLFWNNTNKRLGIGTSSPSYDLHLKTALSTQILIEGTNSSLQSSMYFTNNRGTTFNSYGGFLYGGESQTSTLFGIQRNDKLFLFADGANNLGMIVGTTSNSPLQFGTNNSEKMRITSAGEVWIGYTADNGAYPLQVNGQIFATNATIATSDEKFKENITPLNKGLEIVSKLKPVTFNFISDTENNFSEYEEVGFIAQDVDRALSTETFAKSIVKNADDSEPTSTMGLATQNLIPILVKAIQEQQALIKALEQRILILENK